MVDIDKLKSDLAQIIRKACDESEFVGWSSIIPNLPEDMASSIIYACSLSGEHLDQLADQVDIMKRLDQVRKSYHPYEGAT